METLLKTQQQFLKGVYDRGNAEAEALLKPTRISPAAQMTIYHRHTINALSDVLAQHYPAVEKVVGKKFLKAAARQFISRHPQQHANLELYGLGFPEFLSGYVPARKLAYLSDLARLERALHESEIAEEAGSLSPVDFAIKPEDFMQLRLKMHPSVRLLDSAHPVFDIWQVAMELVAEEETLALGVGGAWRVMKIADEVTVLPLARPEFLFLAAVHEGRTLFEAYEEAMAVAPDFDLENTLKNHIVSGVFSQKF